MKDYKVLIQYESADHSVGVGENTVAWLESKHVKDELICIWTGDVKVSDVFDLVTGKTHKETTYVTRWEDEFGKVVEPPFYGKCVDRALKGFLDGKDEMEGDEAVNRGSEDSPTDG